jgi:hypothetical protein
MLRNLFGKKNKFDDAAKAETAAAIADMLKIQLILVGNKTIEDEHGHLKRKALGYVYGYTDAALRIRGHDMADISIGVPITFQVIRKLWPQHANKCMDYLVKNINSDTLMMAGVMQGGQQYLDFRKHGSARPPMGLARSIIEGDDAQS